MIDNSIVRLPTGVKGLDSLIEGGFIKGDSIFGSWASRNRKNNNGFTVYL